MAEVQQQDPFADAPSWNPEGVYRASDKPVIRSGGVDTLQHGDRPVAYIGKGAPAAEEEDPFKDAPKWVANPAAPSADTADVAPHQFTWRDTWPARAVEGAIDAFKLPHDVMTGQVAPTSDEAIQRSLNLASQASPLPASTRAGVGILGRSIAEEPAIAARNAAAAAKPSGLQAAQTAAEQGAPLPTGMTYESKPAQMLVQGVRKLPFVGGLIDAATGKAVQKVGERVGDVATGMSGGVTDRAATGAITRSALEDTVKANDERINDAYSSLRGMLDQSEGVVLPKTEETYKAILKERGKQANPNAGLEDVKTITELGGTFDELQRARSKIGKQIDFEKANQGHAAGDLKRIYGAMTEDMNHVVSQQASGVHPQQAVNALQKANDTASSLIKSNSKLQQVTSIKTDEGLVGALASATSATKGNLALMAHLRNTMAPEDFEHVAGTILSEWGHNTSTNKFSLSKFATDWTKASDRVKAAMFSPAHKAMLDDFANLGRHLKDADQYANTSETTLTGNFSHGFTAAMGGLTAAALEGNYGPVLAIMATAGAGYAGARWLARPATAAAIARWSRAAMAADKTPTSLTHKSLGLATRNLLNNIRPELEGEQEPAPAQLSPPVSNVAGKSDRLVPTNPASRSPTKSERQQSISAPTK